MCARCRSLRRERRGSFLRMRRAPTHWLLGMLGLLTGRAAGQVISFNRTAGQVEVGTCEGLKKHVELGVDMAVVVTANLRCAQAISVPTGVEVWVGSAAGENYLIAVAEDFDVTDPTSATLLVNPAGSRLTLDELTFANEAGTTGSPGAVRAVQNEGTLDVNGCYFMGLNYASVQDGGAVSAWSLISRSCGRGNLRAVVRTAADACLSAVALSIWSHVERC